MKYRKRLLVPCIAALLTLPTAPLWAIHNEGNGNDSSSGGGANTSGPYDPNGVGRPSDNGLGGGNAVGRPCAGCVGNADDKNPPGQLPGPQDRNAGYECDRNRGIARGNPAHSGCGGSGVTPPPPPNGGTPPGGGGNPPGVITPGGDVAPLLRTLGIGTPLTPAPEVRPAVVPVAVKPALRAPARASTAQPVRSAPLGVTG